MKRRTFIASALALLLTATAVPAHAADFNAMEFEQGPIPITLHVDGRYVPTDVDPIIQNSRTLMPMRAAGEALGAAIGWDGNTRCITIAKDDNLIYFFVGSTDYYINGQTHSTDVAPIIKDGRTLLPIRAFAEALDTTVKWDSDLRDVQIDTPAANAAPATIPSDVSNDVARFIQKYYVAADSSDSVVGSWKTSPLLGLSSMGEKTTTCHYLFISRYQNSYQAIHIGTEQSSFYDGDGVFVQKDTFSARGNNQYLARPMFFNHGYGDDPYIYHRVPGNNTSPFCYYIDIPFRQDGNFLIQTKEIDIDLLEWFDPAYVVYTQF